MVTRAAGPQHLLLPLPYNNMSPASQLSPSFIAQYNNEHSFQSLNGHDVLAESNSSPDQQIVVQDASPIYNLDPYLNIMQSPRIRPLDSQHSRELPQIDMQQIPPGKRALWDGQLWYGVFVMDKWASLGAGMPSHIHADDFDVLPLEDNDLEPSTPPDPNQAITDPEPGSEHFRLLTELTTILSDIIDSRLAVRAGAKECAKEVVEFVENLGRGALDAFWHSWSRANFAIASSFLMQLLVTSEKRK
ncbi:hypothetical protein EYC84_005189 [Monilinia fructicola]|uniref:Xylanolytic transcriptional activator regulatory domain-containing protein n=1 Tax=Monilinia fructicola TaxID=38448 RepID=A0A5M9K0E1_MONFR|nr:hypothetical protein EYC84_005189 [Monilinia fructicola]